MNGLNTEYAETLVDLVNALDEFKRRGGGDAFRVASAIQHFVHAICNQRAAILAESSSDPSSTQE